jgi:hypothetical protein
MDPQITSLVDKHREHIMQAKELNEQILKMMASKAERLETEYDNLVNSLTTDSLIKGLGTVQRELRTKSQEVVAAKKLHAEYKNKEFHTYF